MSTDVAPVLLPTTRSRGALVKAAQEYGIYAAIVILIVVDIVINPRFLSLSNLNVQLTQVVPILVVRLGMALVIGTEGIDLSVIAPPSRAWASR